MIKTELIPDSTFRKPFREARASKKKKKNLRPLLPHGWRDAAVTYFGVRLRGSGHGGRALLLGQLCANANNTHSGHNTTRKIK